MTERRHGSFRYALRLIAGTFTVIVLLGSVYALLALIRSDSSTSSVNSQADPMLISEGAGVYADHCAICHGPSGKGGTGPDLTANLTQRYPDPADQRQIILDGPRSMPSFESRLSDREIDAVIEFTRFGF